MGISRQLQQRSTPARPEVGFTPTWVDFPEGVMSAIMQGMVECRFVDLDGNVFEYRWKPVNGSLGMGILGTQENDPSTGP